MESGRHTDDQAARTGITSMPVAVPPVVPVSPAPVGPSYAERYLGLVNSIARRLGRKLPPTVETDDLISDGAIGLLRALGRYDPGRGVRFATYAQHRIRGAMLDGLRARDPLPRTVRRAQKSLGADSDGIAPPSGILLVDLDHALGLPADDSEGPEEVAVEADLRRRVLDALPLLPPRDRQVLVWRYIRGRTLRDTAEHLALSATRTIEIQERALQRLRRYLDGQPMLLDRRRRSMRTPAPFVSARAEQEAGGRDANRRGAPQGERVS